MTDRIGVAPSRKQQAVALFSGLPRHYDRVAAVLSFGQDPRWRRALVASLPVARSDRVLDVATGTGLVASALVKQKGCSVVGLDQSAEMLNAALSRVQADGELRQRISLLRGEAEALPFADGEFDALTFTYLLRYVDDPAATLGELARVVRPGGHMACIEFGVPDGRASRRAWNAYVRVGLPALGRLVSPDWQAVGKFLGPSIRNFYERHPLAALEQAWREAGIDAVHTRRLSFGGGVVTSGVKGR